MGSITRIGVGRLESIGRIIDKFCRQYDESQYTNEKMKQLIAKTCEILARSERTACRFDELRERARKINGGEKAKKT